MSPHLCAPCAKLLKQAFDPRPGWHVGSPCGHCKKQAVMVGLSAAFSERKGK